MRNRFGVLALLCVGLLAGCDGVGREKAPFEGGDAGPKERDVPYRDGLSGWDALRADCRPMCAGKECGPDGWAAVAAGAAAASSVWA